MNSEVKELGEEKLDVARRSYYQRRSDEVALKIHKAKLMHNLTDKELAQKIGMSYSNFSKKKSDPGGFRESQIWAIDKLIEEVT